MKLAILSCSRLPSHAEACGGLGKSSHDVAVGLARRGHDVTLFACPGSRFDEGVLVEVRGEGQMAQTAAGLEFDAWFDYSHTHSLSKTNLHLPVLNCIGDRECQYDPMNATVATEYMQEKYPHTRIIRTGVDVDNIPFVEDPGDYLIFMARMWEQKGWRRALDVAKKAEAKIHFVGPGGAGFGLPNYYGALVGAKKWAMLGKAKALLAPYIEDASPRVPLEAAACGVPTICLAGDGTKEHVEHGVTGFVCRDLDEMAMAIPSLDLLNRQEIRDWVVENHHLNDMIDKYENALVELARGERW